MGNVNTTSGSINSLYCDPATQNCVIPTNSKLDIKPTEPGYGFTHSANNVVVGSYINSTSQVAQGQLGTKSNHNLGLFANNGGPALVIDTGGNTTVNGKLTTQAMVQSQPNQNLYLQSQGGSTSAISGKGTYAQLLALDANGKDSSSVLAGQGYISLNAPSTTVTGDLIINGRPHNRVGMVDNRNIKPNSLKPGQTEFGFSQFGNGVYGGGWADFVHFNEYWDSSGGNQNLVMFSKDLPAVRVYQAPFQSADAFKNYKDVVMTDQNSQNVSVPANLNMKEGSRINFSWDSDVSSIGLKDYGNNSKHLAITYGDDNDDRLRFIHKYWDGTETEKMSMDRYNIYAPGKIVATNNSADDFAASAIQIGPDNDPGKNTNIYSLNFGGGDGKSYIGMGLLKSNDTTKYHDDTTERIIGTHIRPKGEWGIYSDGWDKLFSVQGQSGKVKVKGDLIMNGGGYLNDNGLKLRGAGDLNHELKFAADPNGPELKGYAGGKLTTALNNKTALKWDSNGNVTVSGTTFTPFIDLGFSDSTREQNAGKIGYGQFDTEALAIVGKGSPGVVRKVHLWDDVIVDNNLTTRGSKVVGGRIWTGGPGNGGVWLDGQKGSGQFIGSIDQNQLGIYNGGNWRLFVGNDGNVNIPYNNLNVGGKITGDGAVPRGTIVMFNSTTPPSGWAVCDGSNGTPDLRGRFILGAGQGSGLTNRNQNEKGGAENHTLTTSEMPAHAHGYPDAFMVENWNWYNDQIGWNRNIIDWNWEGIPNIKSAQGGGDWDNNVMGKYRSTDNAGGNQPHNNMPPYYVLTYIMKL